MSFIKSIFIMWTSRVELNRIHFYRSKSISGWITPMLFTAATTDTHTLLKCVARIESGSLISPQQSPTVASSAFCALSRPFRIFHLNQFIHKSFQFLAHTELRLIVNYFFLALALKVLGELILWNWKTFTWRFAWARRWCWGFSGKRN
jgi:hypothetical protein